MKSTGWFLRVLPCVVLIAALAPAWGQDDEGADAERRGAHIFTEVAAWISQAAGAEFEPASRLDPVDPFGTTLLDFNHSTESEVRYRAGYELPGNWGSLIGTWYSHNEQLGLTATRPNEFIFGQLLSFPDLAGLNNDGLADGFTSVGDLQLRDLRFDYYRTVIKTDRVDARWFVGVRRVRHKRLIAARYAALDPLLPPLLPPFTDPRPDLDPIVETARLESDYVGRGLEAGIDFRAPIVPNNKLEVEGGFVVAALRGKIDTAYRSTNAFYVLTDPMTGERTILEPPYDEFVATRVDMLGQIIPIVDDITQETASIGLRKTSRRASSSVIEANLGLRWHAWKQLDVFAGFRSAYYDKVGVDLRPIVGSDDFGFNAQSIQEVDRSATYEGFYGGISYEF